MNKKILFVFLVISIFILGCSSKSEPTGKVASAPDIYEENTTEQQAGQQEAQANETRAEEQPQVSVNETGIEAKEPEVITPKIKGFEFLSTSIVSKQHNISMSLDNIKYEIKSEYWGKITGITLTVLNNGSAAFKPKVLVLLYDEKDFKEDWLKPKAEIEFDIEKLYPNEHTTRDAIVSISFDDIALTKHFKLILVDAADPANNVIVVVEKEFNPILG